MEKVTYDYVKPFVKQHGISLTPSFSNLDKGWRIDKSNFVEFNITVLRPACTWC